MQNLETKVRVERLEDVQSAAEAGGWVRVHEDHQVDTYFRVSHGRLKLRESRELGARLIGYHRPDGGIRISDYSVIEVTDAGGLKAILAHCLGVVVAVEKRRVLFRKGPVRLHLDRVRDLGDFAELEYELDVDNAASARTEMDEIVQGLGLGAAHMEGQSYSDLLLARATA